MTVASFYLAMRDGVRIAVDLYRPPSAGYRNTPCILHQTRYFRRVAWRGSLGARLNEDPFDEWARIRPRFLAAGHAWMDVDVRGSGASFGRRPSPWSEDEVEDGVELVAWIRRQPWSNGRVGALGNSYAGTAAELLASRGVPGLVAVAPRFSCIDLYPGILRPGGVWLRWFSEAWSDVNAAFDRDALGDVVGRALVHRMESSLARTARSATVPVSPRPLFAGIARAAFVGVRAVDSDRDRRLVRAAVRDHQRNYDVMERAAHLRFSDDVPPDEPGGLERFSPHARASDTGRRPTAVLAQTGWFDAGYTTAGIERFSSYPNAMRLVIGPWDHGGGLDVGDRDATPAVFDHAGELLRFFDAHAWSRPRAEVEAGVAYFVRRADVWRTAPSWPPESRVDVWRTHPGGRLQPSPGPTLGPEPGEDAYRVDRDATTGRASRWRSLIGPHTFIGYPDRDRASTRCLNYTSDPLPEDSEVVGNPSVVLFVGADAPDADLFVYLEAVAPSGHVTYVTEAQLRLSLSEPSPEPPPYAAVGPYRSFRRDTARALQAGERRRVELALIPCAFVFRAGESIRLTIAGTDRDSFEPIVGTSPTLFVRYGSTLRLPGR